VNRTETILGAFFLATWIVAGVYRAGWVGAPGLRWDFYGQFAFAACWGWLVGNLYVLRLRTIPAENRTKRRLFLPLYLVVPAGVVALVRSMEVEELRVAAPLVGWLALGIHALFFFVPVSLRRR